MKLYRNFCCALLLAGITCYSGLAQKPVLEAAGTQLHLQGKLLLDARQDGFLSIKEVVHAPDSAHFAVIACGYECNDNVGFLFNADGMGKRKLTARWDYILQAALEWSTDGRTLYYFRINSSGAKAPRSAPPTGWVEVNAKTGRKAPATTRRLSPTARYAVINLRRADVLQVRAQPGLRAKVVGALPHNAKGISVTGASASANGLRWVRVQTDGIAGWVNQNYLCQERTGTN